MVLLGEDYEQALANQSANYDITLYTLAKALSNEARYEIFMKMSDGESYDAAALEKAGFSCNELRYNLKELVESKIVTCKKEGNRNIYSIDQDLMDAMTSQLSRMSPRIH